LMQRGWSCWRTTIKKKKKIFSPLGRGKKGFSWQVKVGFAVGGATKLTFCFLDTLKNI
jgi:hypothetical protein